MDREIRWFVRGEHLLAPNDAQTAVKHVAEGKTRVCASAGSELRSGPEGVSVY